MICIKQNEKYQQTFKFFEKLSRKNNLTNEIEIEFLCKFFTKFVDVTEKVHFL